MKKLKYITAFIMGAILLFSGCTQSESNSSSGGRTETLNSLGLEYTLPEEWDTIVDTNVFRFIVAPDGAFAMVRYSYATNDALNILAAETSVDEGALDDYLTPICSILIYNKEDEGSPSLNNIMSEYQLSEKLSEQGSYVYYGLWDYSDLSKIPKGSLDDSGYKKLSKSASKLMSSVKTFDFDPEEILSQTNTSSNVITFMSSTLEGEEISSTIFSSYDLTMVYFWGSYCYPDINELPELQKVYETLKENYPNVNLLLALIDTPDEKAEAAAKNAMLEAGCTFDAFKMDSTIGSWVLNNLEGLPTTIFVDKDGTITGQTITGLQSSSVYIDSINNIISGK